MGQQFAVIYGKVVDDKELGVYLGGVYLGGVADTRVEAGLLARNCVNSTRGGTIFPRIYVLSGPHNLTSVMQLAVDHFNNLERQLVEAETVMKKAQSRGRR